MCISICLQNGVSPSPSSSQAPFAAAIPSELFLESVIPNEPDDSASLSALGTYATSAFTSVTSNNTFAGATTGATDTNSATTFSTYSDNRSNKSSYHHQQLAANLFPMDEESEDDDEEEDIDSLSLDKDTTVGGGLEFSSAAAAGLKELTAKEDRGGFKKLAAGRHC